MAHSFHQSFMHLVFSTKDRKKMIAPERQKALNQSITGIGRNHKILIMAVNGVEDHLHVLFVLPVTMPLAKAVQTLKANSSRMLRPQIRNFAWQEGYGAFSVSPSKKDEVAAYIANQQEHHKKYSFEQEFIILLKKHKIEYDPQYVFG